MRDMEDSIEEMTCCELQTFIIHSDFPKEIKQEALNLLLIYVEAGVDGPP